MVIRQQQHGRSISLRVLGHFFPSSFAPFGRGALNEIRPHLSFSLSPSPSRRVHVTETTADHLRGEYELEPGPGLREQVGGWVVATL